MSPPQQAATFDPNGSYAPAPSASAAFDPNGSYAPASAAATTNTAQQPPAEQPGYFTRLGQSLGLPTTKEELLAMQPKFSGQNVASLAANSALGPLGSAAYNYGKTAYQGIKEGVSEAGEAGENMASGQPIAPNVGKVAHAALHAVLQSTPFVGPSIETAGQDIQNKNYTGAAGGLTGVVGQIAAPDIIEKGPEAASAAVRGGAKAANTVLEKVPGAIGGGVGGVIGGLLGHHYGMTDLGSAIGLGATGLAERALPSMRVPGENFGLPAPKTPIEVLQSKALQNVPATGAQPASATGEALGKSAVPTDQNIPAGKTPAAGQRPDGPYSGPRTPVMETAQSGHLEKIGYHADTQTAVVEFQNGKVYEYRNVPPEVYSKLQNAESQGSFVAQNLKGRYQTNFRGAVKPVTAGAKAKAALLNQSGTLGRQ